MSEVKARIYIVKKLFKNKKYYGKTQSKRKEYSEKVKNTVYNDKDISKMYPKK